jgi:hypothetical protein
VVPESLIPAICLLDEEAGTRFVRLTSVELEQVIKIVGRSPRRYLPGAYEARRIRISRHTS